MAKRTAVLVAGARTPFVSSFGVLTKVDSVALGVHSVGGLLKKTGLDPMHINNIIWGNVVLQTTAPNMAREIVIDLNLPAHIVGHMTSMACASGLNAAIQAQLFIETGVADVVVAGGSDSISNAEVPLPRHIMHAAGLSQKALKKGGPLGFAKSFFSKAGFPSGKWLPKMPAVAERSTGKTMGWHADMMAEMNAIARSEQERFAVRSHANAAKAAEKGYLAEEVVPTPSGDKDGSIITEDNLIRRDMTETSIRSMKPVFRKTGGTITAPTSSALTDGGSAVLMMDAARARELGQPADVRMRSFSMSAIDPMPQLLLAPALAIPHALDQAGLTLADIDVFELHEAFAAQVLVTIKVLNDPAFLKEYLNGRPPLGDVPEEKLNVNGGSIAIGHPFAATGGRVLTAAMNELRRSGKRFALTSICAAGGLGGVAVLEYNPAGFV